MNELETITKQVSELEKNQKDDQEKLMDKLVEVNKLNKNLSRQLVSEKSIVEELNSNLKNSESTIKSLNEFYKLRCNDKNKSDSTPNSNEFVEFFESLNTQLDNISILQNKIEEEVQIKQEIKTKLDQEISNNSKIEADNKKIVENLDVMKKDLIKTKQEKDELNNNIHKLQDQCKELENNFDKINHENNELINKIEALSKEKADIVEERNKLKKEVDNIEILNNEFSKLEEQLKSKIEIECKYNELQKTNHILENDLSENIKFKNECDKLNSLLKANNDEITDLKSKLCECEVNLQDKARLIECHMNDNVVFNQQLKEMKSKCEETVKESSNLKDMYLELKSLNIDLEKEIHLLKEENQSELKASLENKHSNYIDKETSIDFEILVNDGGDAKTWNDASTQSNFIVQRSYKNSPEYTTEIFEDYLLEEIFVIPNTRKLEEGSKDVSYDQVDVVKLQNTLRLLKKTKLYQQEQIKELLNKNEKLLEQISEFQNMQNGYHEMKNDLVHVQHKYDEAEKTSKILQKKVDELKKSITNMKNKKKSEKKEVLSNLDKTISEYKLLESDNSLSLLHNSFQSCYDHNANLIHEMKSYLNVTNQMQCEIHSLNKSVYEISLENQNLKSKLSMKPASESLACNNTESYNYDSIELKNFEKLLSEKELEIKVLSMKLKMMELQNNFEKTMQENNTNTNVSNDFISEKLRIVEKFNQLISEWKNKASLSSETLRDFVSDIADEVTSTLCQYIKEKDEVCTLSVKTLKDVYINKIKQAFLVNGKNWDDDINSAVEKLGNSIEENLQKLSSVYISNVESKKRGSNFNANVDSDKIFEVTSILIQDFEKLTIAFSGLYQELKKVINDELINFASFVNRLKTQNVSKVRN